MTYAIVLGIDADVKRQGPGLLSLTRAFMTRVSGRDPEFPSEPDSFRRFILGDTQPEIDVMVYVGYEEGISGPIRNVIEALPANVCKQTQYAAGVTQRDIERQQILRADADGCPRVWVVRVGQTVDGFLIDLFIPIADALAALG